MNKRELVTTVAERAALTQAEVDRVVQATIDVITEQLSDGGEVSLSGLGKFSVVERGAREGRNPATGEKMQIGPSRGPKFTAAAPLKAAVKG